MEELAKEVSNINIINDLPESSPSSSTPKKVKKRRSRRKPKAKNVIEAADDDIGTPFCGTISPLPSVSSGVCIKKKINSDTKRIMLETKNGPIEYKTSSLVFKSNSQGSSKNSGNITNSTEIKNNRLGNSPRKMLPRNINKVNVLTDNNGTTSPASSSKPSTSGRSKKKKTPKKVADDKEEKEAPKFENYYDLEDVKKGLENGTLVKGVLRINPKFYTEAYVSQVDKSLQDYYISSIADRNRALEGDIVVLKIKPESEWRDNQKKAQVVYIQEMVHARTAIGFLFLKPGDKKKVAQFQPRDKRIPFFKIPENSLPPNVLKSPQNFKNTLFMARIIDWQAPNNAVGELISYVGEASEIKSETVAILLENSVDFEPFPAELTKDLPKTAGINPEDLLNREDFRGNCIFTIDPSTAKDLDDAVSCKKLPNGNFEVGVHIADVTHYLYENTPLDQIVCKKATSTYLVEKVYHMLPIDLCMICSLLPGLDSLTFSVVWELNNEAEIISTRFTRSVINSCTKLAYEHAQYVIENPNKEYDPKMFPSIHNGYSLQDVCRSISELQSLALHLRRRRIGNGALRIDQLKLGFNLDTAGNPVSFFIQENKEANRLIEEFMLLANISVAKKIYEHFPQLAFLRCHIEPNMRLLSELKNYLETIGIHINIDSSGDLNSSINKYKTNDYLGYTRYIALNHLLAKPMVRADYFCANNCDPHNFRHYALSIPIYTHFTSPIRRYADIMVHRLLAACLGYTPEPTWSSEQVAEIAKNCNQKKFYAKKAGEASCELYLAYYIEMHKPFISEAVVVGVQDKSFDVITLRTGSTIRIYTNNFDKGVTFSTTSFESGSKKLWKMTVLFPPTPTLPGLVQVVDILQIVQVSLQRKEKSNKLEGFLIRPVNLRTL